MTKMKIIDKIIEIEAMIDSSYDDYDEMTNLYDIQDDLADQLNAITMEILQ